MAWIERSQIENLIKLVDGVAAIAIGFNEPHDDDTQFIHRRHLCGI